MIETSPRDVVIQSDVLLVFLKKRKISFSSLFFVFLLIILENMEKENRKEITDLYVTITIAIINVKIGKAHKC